jgi:hypothetical protein
MIKDNHKAMTWLKRFLKSWLKTRNQFLWISRKVGDWYSRSGYYNWLESSAQYFDIKVNKLSKWDGLNSIRFSFWLVRWTFETTPLNCSDSCGCRHQALNPLGCIFERKIGHGKHISEWLKVSRTSENLDNSLPFPSFVGVKFQWIPSCLHCRKWYHMPKLAESFPFFLSLFWILSSINRF